MGAVKADPRLGVYAFSFDFEIFYHYRKNVYYQSLELKRVRKFVPVTLKFGLLKTCLKIVTYNNMCE